MTVSAASLPFMDGPDCGMWTLTVCPPEQIRTSGFDGFAR